MHGLRKYRSVHGWVAIGAARLVQLDKRRSAEREAAGSSPGRINTQGL